MTIHQLLEIAVVVMAFTSGIVIGTSYQMYVLLREIFNG